MQPWTELEGTCYLEISILPKEKSNNPAPPRTASTMSIWHGDLLYVPTLRLCNPSCWVHWALSSIAVFPLPPSPLFCFFSFLSCFIDQIAYRLGVRLTSYQRNQLEKG